MPIETSNTKQLKNANVLNANVLLISNDENDFNKLKEYGFKNIEWFKSIIIADKRLDENILENYIFENYDIVLISRDQMIYKIPGYKMTQLEKYLNNNFWRPNKLYYRFRGSLQEHLYQIVKEATLQNVVPGHSFSNVEQYPNRRKLKLPNELNKLKILCLCPVNNTELQNDIKQELQRFGINPDNITFIYDDGYALNKIKNKLGEYDIIIAPDSTSNVLLTLKTERDEQCKDAGRDLTTFVTYKYKEFGLWEEEQWDPYQFGEHIVLTHQHGGILAPNSTNYEEEMRVLKNTTDSPDNKKNIIAIIAASIHYYNAALEKKYCPKLADVATVPTIKQYTQEYDNEKAVVAERKEREDEGRENRTKTVQAYLEMCNTVTDFIRYVETEKIPRVNRIVIPENKEDDTPKKNIVTYEGLRISQSAGTFTIEFINGPSQILGTVTFEMPHWEQDDLDTLETRHRNEIIDDEYTFYICCSTKDGRIQSPQAVSIRISNDDDGASPSAMTLNQISTLTAIQQRVAHSLSALIHEMRENEINAIRKEKAKKRKSKKRKRKNGGKKQ